MKKSLTWGPIECAFQVTDEFLEYKAFDSEGKIVIYDQDLDVNKLNHAVSLVGWNKTEDGQEYWIVRNSWGRHFGDNGFFYLKAGTNSLGFESSCAWADPELVQDF